MKGLVLLALAGGTLVAGSAPAQQIRATSRLWAELISSGGLAGTREARDAFCQAQR